VPEHPPPDQPANVDPPTAAAVSVTGVPGANDARHVAPHVIPAGALVTVPAPVPGVLTVTVNGARLNVAVTINSAEFESVLRRLFPSSRAEAARPERPDAGRSGAGRQTDEPRRVYRGAATTRVADISTHV
jgi:hypothetical protein